MEDGSTIISISFMFSSVYLKLEDNVLEIGPNNAIEKIISSEVSKCILQSTPPPSFLPVPYLILCLNRRLVNFNFKCLKI